MIEKAVITGIGVICGFELHRGATESIEDLFKVYQVHDLSKKIRQSADIININCTMRNNYTSLFCHDSAVLLSLEASRLAINEAQLTNNMLQTPEENGIIIGMDNMASELELRDNDHKFVKKKKEHLFDVGPKILSIPQNPRIQKLENSPAELISFCHKINTVVCSHTKGLNSGIIAFERSIDLIAKHKISRIIVGAIEGEAKTELTLQLKRSGFLAPVKRQFVPFGLGGSGFMVGSGSAAFVLEQEKVAKQRKSKIGIRVTGFFSRSIADFKDRKIEELTGSYKNTMLHALKRANTSFEKVGFIQANGIGIPKIDLAEAVAMKDLFGGKTPITSCTGLIGYTLVAAGTISIALSCFQLLLGKIVPISSKGLLFHQDQLNYVRKEPILLKHKVSLVNCFDMLGNMTSLVLEA